MPLSSCWLWAISSSSCASCSEALWRERSTSVTRRSNHSRTGEEVPVLSSPVKCEQRHEPSDSLGGNISQRKDRGERVAPGFVRRFA